ncbi:MAG: endopeptidase La [Chloroflexi bacterium]|nr:MAG: endopeptidase La [Chloroflexota bacterium]MBL1197309.1 endopeptidase La [Chloroflexota bacterium]NOH14605.1 endopeptidase La [Chloroflexota bacterium]
MPEHEYPWGDDSNFFPQELQNYAENLEEISDIEADEQGLIAAPLLPLRDHVILPQMVAPLYIGRPATLSALAEAQDAGHTVIALAQRQPDLEDPSTEDFLPIGIEMAVSPLVNARDGNKAALVQGRRRVEVLAFLQDEPFPIVQARVIQEPEEVDDELETLMRAVLRNFDRFVQLSGSLPEEAYHYALNIKEPGWLADMVAMSFPLSLEEQHKLLNNVNPRARLDRVHKLVRRELDALRIDEEIHSKVQGEFERGQRESYLREQLKAIQGELGETDLWTAEVHELQERVAKTELPDEIKTQAVKEVGRLAQMPPMTPEVGVIRTYIDWLLELPWVKSTEDNLDIAHAAGVLDEHHYGLPKAKERILEYIAVRSLRPKRSRQPILCFVGPPGTGKTSLGRSIAESLGRKFVRVSLGGVRDEAEIRGHRRTYIGALPGRIIQTMRRAEVANPLFMLDEIDKLSMDVRGDPASALLEVLDPEQNFAFSDHYLELPFDLSKVMFITTANVRQDIPWALQDRMEMIEFPGYIEEEKLEIARRFLIHRQAEESGLEDGEIHFNEGALKRIIREYTYEAGVRNLEREVGRVSRKVARLKAESKRYPTKITPETVERLLGPPQFTNAEAERDDEVGVATAVAWTEGGGDIMPVEVLLMEGKGNLQITGQIGEVMQESAQAALSYLKSRSKDFKLKAEVFENTDVHVHIPEGAIPKDGPSAGITIATAIISAFTRRPVRHEIGMTGEITLRGRVLPVGGVREKVLAAHRAGLTKVIMPERNMKDLLEVPKKARADLDIIPVERMDEVLKAALLTTKAPKKVSTAPKTKESSSRIQPGA